MRKQVRSSFLLVIAIIITACGGEKSTQDRPTPVIATNSPIQHTTGTPTVIPTKTRTMTLTMPPTIAAFSTQLAAQWTVINNNLIMRGAICNTGFSLDRRELTINMSNDDWTIFACSPEFIKVNGRFQMSSSMTNSYTEIISTDLSIKWRINYKDFKWSEQQGDILAVRQWTLDGKYVYLYPYGQSIYGDGGDESIYFFTGIGLYRVNLISGLFETILPDSTSYSYAISDDGKHLAYSRINEPKKFQILDLSTGRVNTIILDGNYAMTGAITWNPDNKTVVFASAADGWKDKKAGTSVFRVNTEDMSVHTIIFNDLRMLIPFPAFDIYHEPQYWSDNNTVYLAALHEEGVDYHYYTFNIWSGEMNSIPTETPNPTITPTQKP